MNWTKIEWGVWKLRCDGRTVATVRQGEWRFIWRVRGVVLGVEGSLAAAKRAAESALAVPS